VIAAFLRRLTAGEDTTAPLTWRGVALRLGLRVHDYHAPGAGRGEYLSSGESGIVAINTAYPESEQARAWVHELAHHLLNVWEPPQMADSADVYCYEGDVSDIRHGIATETERILCGDRAA
jgi:hypothetical protein